MDNPDNVGAYYKLLEDMDDLQPNYRDYMTTAPINCDVELERVPTADWDLACALLTSKCRDDDYRRAMAELTSFSFTAKNLHDDAPDSLAMLTSFISERPRVVAVAKRPF